MAQFNQYELEDKPARVFSQYELPQITPGSLDSATMGSVPAPLSNLSNQRSSSGTYIQPELPPPAPRTPPISFTNEGVVLRQGVFKSPNHVKNKKGWAIDSEGDGEFNSLSVRNVFKTVPEDGDVQSALNFVAEAGGGQVHLGAGTYYPTTDIIVPENVTLIGTGSGTVIDFDGQALQIRASGTDGYTTGTVAINNDSLVVTGSGTSWTAAMIGRSILLDGLWFPITDVNSSTELEIAFSYIGPNISGEEYAIANPLFGAVISSLTVQNSTAPTGAVFGEFLDTSFIDKISALDSTIGVGLNNSSGTAIRNTGGIGCGIGISCNNGGAATVGDWFAIGNTQAGLHIENIYNLEVANFSSSGNGGNGITFTHSRNIGVIDFSIDNNTGCGIEMTNDCEAIQVIVGTLTGNTSDGIKLTATTDKCTLGPLVLESNGGYGINIAASTCDNNLVLGNNYLDNFSGNINDDGTDTILIPNTPNFIAAEDLTKGQPVGISNYVSGQVARAFRNSTSNTLSFSAGFAAEYPSLSCPIGGDRLVFLSKATGSLYATVVQFDPDTNAVTLGTSLLIAGATSSNDPKTISVCKLDTDKFLILGVDASSTSDVWYCVCTVSGTTITKHGSGSTLVAGVGVVAQVSSCQIATDKAITMIGGATSKYYIAVSVSGTTATIGSSVAWGTSIDNNYSNIHICKVDTDKFIAVGAGTNSYCQVGTVSGTTITLGSDVQFSSTANLDYTVTVVPLSTSLVVVNAVKSGYVPYLTAISISGTTPTPGTEVSGTQYQLTLIKDSSTSFLTGAAISSGEQSLRKYTISGTTITSVGAIVNSFSSMNQLLLTDNSTKVGLYSGGGTTFTCWIEGMSNSFFGFAESTVSSGGSVGVVTTGKIGGLSGLIPGATYQVTSTGLTLVASNATVNSVDDVFVTASSDTEVVL